MSDQEEPVEVSREQLFSDVWATPMSTLAKRYGLSDVGLAKVCKKHNIPRPARGHWSKLKFDKAAPQPTLPPCNDPALETIALDPRRESTNEADPDSEAAKLEPIPVPEEVAKPHPLIRATMRMRRTPLAKRPHELRGAEHGLPVGVSNAQWGRAKRILHALICAVEEHGHTIDVDTGYSGRSMCLVVGSDRVFFSLDEISEQVPETAASRKADSSSWSQRSSREYRRSGRLSLEIDTHSRSRCRRRWRDGKKQRVELCLAEFLQTVLRIAVEVAEDRRQREEEWRKRQEWEKQRTDKLREIEQETANVSSLMREADQWKRSQDLREFIATTERVAIKQQGQLEPDGKTAKWLTWATAQADRLDPFMKSPPSILDEKQQWERSPGSW